MSHRSPSPSDSRSWSRSRSRSRSRSPRRSRRRSLSISPSEAKRERTLSPHSQRKLLSSQSSATSADDRRHRPSNDRSRSSSSRQYPAKHSRRESSRHRESRRSKSPSPARTKSRRYRSRSPAHNCRVFFGNLAYDCRARDLKYFAKEVGTVIDVEILETPSGSSKGCGVVEFSRPEYAERAIRKLDRVDFMGRPVFVREDRGSRRERPERNNQKDAQEATPEQRLHVGNLPFSTSWQDLKDVCRQVRGRVLHTDVHIDERTRRSNGTGLVIYEDAATAQRAIEQLNKFEFRGRKLHVCLERDASPPTTSRSSSHDQHDTDPPPPPPPSANAFFVPPMGLVGGPGASLPSQGKNQIFVTNLPFSTTWQDLIDLFRHVGPVVRAEIQMSNGHPKGSGLVRFEEYILCERAIEKFNGYFYGGRHLDIRIDKYSA